MAGPSALRPAQGLVPRTRSSHHTCRESGCELRVQSGTRIIELLVPFDSEVRSRARRKMMRASESGHYILVSFDSEVRIGRAGRLGELRNRDTRPFRAVKNY